jgi:hypothetical protein
MTPRQRRGVLLLFVAGIGAILVFSLISGYVSDVRKDVEPKTGVLVLTRAVPELQPIPPDAVALKSVPEKWVGRQALRDQSQIGALVPNEPLPAGVELQQGMLVEPPALEKGQQQIRQPTRIHKRWHVLNLGELLRPRGRIRRRVVRAFVKELLPVLGCLCAQGECVRPIQRRKMVTAACDAAPDACLL